MVERKSRSLNSQQRTLNSFACGERGGKGTRTPDIQLAKLALYQLSYAPVRKLRDEGSGLRGSALSTLNLQLSTAFAGQFARRSLIQQTLDGAFFLYSDLRSFRSIGFAPAGAGSDSPCRGGCRGLGVTP
jgi:hypothetical protein